MKTLVVTGLFSPLSAAVARWAVDNDIRVLGIDMRPLTRPWPGIEFIQADIQNPLLPKLLKAEQVDVIFHGAFRWRIHRQEGVLEGNVMGTMKLMEAAALAGVHKVVMPSSTFVYGAHPSNPYFMPEVHAFRGRSYYAYIQDLRDMEIFLGGFRKQHPEIIVTILRFANILGRNFPSPLTRYLSLPVIPTLMGHDPLMQVIHFDDVVRVSTQALEEEHTGVFNVAASPPVSLQSIIHCIGRHSVPLLPSFAYAGQNVVDLLIKKDQGTPPIPWTFLRYPWIASTEKIERMWGFAPQHDAHAVIKKFSEELTSSWQQGVLQKTTRSAVRVAADGIQKMRRLFHR